MTRNATFAAGWDALVRRLRPGQHVSSGHGATTSRGQQIAFVGGSPRSGTSALAQMLTSHPDVAIMHERYATLSGSGNLSARHFEPGRVQKFKEGDGSRAAFDLKPTQTAFEKWATAKVVGDKIPNVRSLLKAAENIDGIKVVVIIREPFGTSHSSQVRFDDPEDAFALDYKGAVALFNQSMKTLENYGEKVNRFELMLVDYATVFTDPAEVERLFHFLGVDPAKGEAAFEIQRQMGPDRRKTAEVNNYVADVADFERYRQFTASIKKAQQTFAEAS